MDLWNGVVRVNDCSSFVLRQEQNAPILFSAVYWQFVLTMLPAFPKAQEFLEEEWNKKMLESKDINFPLQLHPPVHPIVEGKESSLQREDGKIAPFRMQRLEVKSEHNVRDGKGMTLDVFNEKAKQAGEGWGKHMFEMMLGAVQEAVKETGNEVRIQKGQFKKEDFLRMVESTLQNFDEQGNPTAQFICGHEFAEEMKKKEAEWREDKEFVAKVEELKKRKKAEFNEREARRRLVD